MLNFTKLNSLNECENYGKKHGLELHYNAIREGLVNSYNFLISKALNIIIIRNFLFSFSSENSLHNYFLKEFSGVYNRWRVCEGGEIYLIKLFNKIYSSGELPC